MPMNFVFKAHENVRLPQGIVNLEGDSFGILKTHIFHLIYFFPSTSRYWIFCLCNVRYLAFITISLHVWKVDQRHAFKYAAVAGPQCFCVEHPKFPVIKTLCYNVQLSFSFLNLLITLFVYNC